MLGGERALQLQKFAGIMELVKATGIIGHKSIVVRRQMWGTSSAEAQASNTLHRIKNPSTSSSPLYYREPLDVR